ncbi:MAG: hypothetical protein Rhob2KO_54740 [Rhodopirellula baltica]
MIVDVWVPSALGSKVTVNVTDPRAAIEPLVVPDTANCVLSEDVTLVSVSVSVPVFWIVKTFALFPLDTETLPKSVSSAADGVVSPLTILVPFP